MLLILLLIEEEKATIVEVETDAHALVLQDARPAAAGLPIAVDALHDEQGSIVARLIRARTCCSMSCPWATTASEKEPSPIWENAILAHPAWR